MLQRAKKRRVRGSIVLAAIFASAFVLPHNEVLAFHRHSPESPQSYQSRINQSNLQQPELSRPAAHHSRIYQPRAYRSRAARPPVHYSYWRDHDPLLRLLPLGVALLTIAGIHYYYHQERDVYYRQAPSGYITVPPPIGACVKTLPIGYTTFYASDARYFYYGGVYYRRAPAGYIVVNPPYMIQSSSGAAEPSATGSSSARVTVTAQLLNVRSGPGVEHPIIHQVAKGTLLETHGTAPGWLYVKLPVGCYGWVMIQFTASSTPATCG